MSFCASWSSRLLQHALADQELVRQHAERVFGQARAGGREARHLHRQQQADEHEHDACTDRPVRPTRRGVRSAGVMARTSLTAICAVAVDVGRADGQRDRRRLGAGRQGRVPELELVPAGRGRLRCGPCRRRRCVRTRACPETTTQAAMLSWMLQPSTATPGLSNSRGAVGTPAYSFSSKVMMAENE